MIDDRVRAIFEAGGVDLAFDNKSIRLVYRWLSALPDQTAFVHFVRIIASRRKKFERTNLRRPRSIKYYAPVARSLIGFYSGYARPEKAQDGDKFLRRSQPPEI